MNKVYVLTELVNDYFGKIDKEQYEQLIEDGSLQHLSYQEFLYI